MQASIVIPAYNAQGYLGETIKSVLIQTLPDWELVVVDDGSTDGTAAIAQTYARRDTRIRLVQQHHAGPANAHNRGYEETDVASHHIAFLEADDLWERDALDTLVESLQAHPDAVAAHGIKRFIDPDGQPVLEEVVDGFRGGLVGERVVEWPRDQPTTFPVLATGHWINSSGQLLIRRSAMAGMGPFDPESEPGHAWDMHLRLSQRGDIAFVDRVVVAHRLSDTSNKGMVGPTHFLRHHAHTYRKLLCSEGLTEEQRRVLLTVYAVKCIRVVNIVFSPDIKKEHRRYSLDAMVRLRENLTELVASGRMNEQHSELALTGVTIMDDALATAEQWMQSSTDELS